ncbi:MAG: DUF4249 domain-containing protein [Ginsengibacter sp.]
MKSLSYMILFLSVLAVACTSCKKPYAPPAIKVDNKFLVIDGVLVNSIDSPTVFTLSRTVRLTDSTTSSSPEPGALVSIEGNTGEIFNLSEYPNGIYKADHLVLNSTNQYRLKIITSPGGEYASDFVEVKQTQPIDSVRWEQHNDVFIYLYSHDPTNNSRYYRWDFTETWQYRARLESELGVSNGLMYYVVRQPDDQKYNCWGTDNATDLLLGSTAVLSQDVVNKAPIAVVPQNSVKINVRYSILVKQYAITDKAYQYLQILKKNTENLGSLFDAQPTQLLGNIHSLTNPSEIVIGYLTASSVQQKRIFINKDEVTQWNYIYPGRTCDEQKVIDQNPTNYLLYNYPDTGYAPYFFAGTTGLVINRVSCLDCTLQGGVNKKPSYW